ncbi:unnamed protein product [Durusdinium trenchii]|uniref:Transmembrane protein n=1 Tax=Durusdinium trenchii TaxID=1381693 RepID=A0ABP0P1L5_9DINO
MGDHGRPVRWSWTAGSRPASPSRSSCIVEFGSMSFSSLSRSLLGGQSFAGDICWIRGTIMIALLCANYVLCLLLEPCRLYLGYAGNLGEKVPELFLFVFLCLGCIGILVAELALSSYLEDFQPGICSLAANLPCIFTIEQVCWVIRLVLSVFELLLGLRALRRLIHEQSARFFVALDEGAPFDDLSGGPWAADRSRPNLNGRSNLERTQPDGRDGVSSLGPRAQVYGRPASPQRLHAD